MMRINLTLTQLVRKKCIRFELRRPYLSEGESRYAILSRLNLPGNFSVIRNMEEYEAHVYSHLTNSCANSDESCVSMNNEPIIKTLACYFTAGFSTAGRMLTPAYVQLARDYFASGAQVSFLYVDVDQCPRAAYHAEVENVPAVLVCRADDAFKRIVHPQRFTDTSSLLNTAKIFIETALKIPTSDLRSFTAKHTHNIPLDNLNVHRVNWPTV